MEAYNSLKKHLQLNQYTWLITGVAGFIGSNLLESLLELDQKVIGLDNFLTGNNKNLLEVQECVSLPQWDNFHFVEGDICNLSTCFTGAIWVITAQGVVLSKGFIKFL